MAFLITSFPININPNNLFSPLRTTTACLLHPAFRNREFQSWKKKRRRRKPNLLFSFPLNQLNSPSPSPSSFSLDFLSLLPLDWLPPAALGFASALAISISTRKVKDNDNNATPIHKPPRVSDVGEWILFTSPTPFNRFVLLRCPSISFQGGDECMEEDVSEKLVTEEKHYVRLDTGRIRVSKEEEEGGGGGGGGGGDSDKVEEREIEYQRECVKTDDGGVISLDWPCNLDLRDERGLDTTVLLIPGTAKGSMDHNVRSFVRKCLHRGLFPVVMNPRGCAGSPLTTAR